MSRKKQKNKKRFLEVDIWRKQFGPVSVKAIYDIYCQKFGVEKYNINKYSLTHCINALRKLENPQYKAPSDKISY